mmetsp:Transcript_31493/g.65057  ORF Transcript_31493/g.65057 Transcript_31493/m.65057 type:complete len:317 (+) Transcript_31493:48-998(+)
MSSTGNSTCMTLQATTQSQTHVLRGAAIGGLSGCLAKTMVAPLSRIVIQMQLFNLHGAEVAGIRSTARGIYAEGGLRAFWRGNGAMLGHRCVTNGCIFPVNELFKKWLQPLPTHQRDFLAALAGSVAGTAAGQPLDVVKTKLSASERFGYDSIWQTVARISREEGWRGFYAGFKISCGTIIPTVTVCFFLKDYFRDSHLVGLLSSRSGGWIPPVVLSGAAGGIGAALLTFPLDAWKRQAQMAGGNKLWQQEIALTTDSTRVTTHRAAPFILAWQYLARQYHGLPCELIKVSLNTGIMFGLYEKMSSFADSRAVRAN